MAIDRIPGVGPTNADIATAVAAPSAATIAAAVAAPSSATIASAVAAAVPTTAGITSIVQSNAGGKTMKRLTLTGGTSWTVPTGVTFVNVSLYGGGGGTGGSNQNGGNGGQGGTTTFTGATSSPGGVGGNYQYYNGNIDGVTPQANSSLGALGRHILSSNVGMMAMNPGFPGTVIHSTLATTPGASISYSIGGGGSAGAGQFAGTAGASGRIDVEYWS